MAGPKNSGLAEDFLKVERVAPVEFDMVKDEWEHRKKVSSDIIKPFIIINLSIVAAIAVICAAELGLVVWKLLDPVDRIIDHRVLIAIISATTVQFGAIAIGVTGWLFPRNRPPK